MCPPSRSLGRIGSSRLTGIPAAAAASELRDNVSFISWAVKDPSWTLAAVTHTPLTATESPCRSSAASGLVTVRRIPSGPATPRSIRPTACTKPVNITVKPVNITIP